MFNKINIEDLPHKYNIDELTCYEHPIATALNYFDSSICNIYILLSKLYGIYMVDNQVNNKIRILDNLKKYTDINIVNIKKLSWKYIMECINNNILVIVGVNLYDIDYSDNYLKKDWGHWFLIKGYDKTNGTVIVFDNVQYNELGEKYGDFRITYDMLIKAHKSFIKRFPDEIRGISMNFIGKVNQKYRVQIKRVIFLYQSVNLRNDSNYRQYHILNELKKLIDDNGRYGYYIEEFKKKLININKYREVFACELCNSMEYLGYDSKKINHIKILYKYLNDMWKIFILRYSVAIINGCEKKIEISEEIKKYEEDIQMQTKEYLSYIEKNVDVKNYTSRIKHESKNNITYKIINDFDNIINGNDESIQFSFLKSKLYNWWIDDYAPKVCITKIDFCELSENKYFYIRTQLHIRKNEKFTEGQKYQAGFYIKTYDDDSNYMCAIDGQEGWCIDKVGDEGESICIKDTYNIFAILTKGAVAFGIYDGDKERILLRRKIIETGEIEVGLVCKTWGKAGRIEITFKNTEWIMK